MIALLLNKEDMRFNHSFSNRTSEVMPQSSKTYSLDKDFLKSYITLNELESEGSKILISPQLQGRVMTSTAEGEKGYSFGWINYDLISSGTFLPHCNNFGGEDRYWIGPEGGQYSIFFKKGASFDLENWQTPASIDTEAWDLLSADNKKITLQKSMELVNYAGNSMNLIADRTILIHDSSEVSDILGVNIPEDVNQVGFTSINKMTNTGDYEWTHDTGMLSIWILAQLVPSDRNTIILPVKNSNAKQIVNDKYFGAIDKNRLKITDSAVFFKGDGKKRGKIGVGYAQVSSIVGSYDPVNEVLTIVKFSLDESSTDYVNSMWEWQKEPYNGDVVNSYNDGPLPDGTIMGPFYELETSSPAASLKPSENIVHTHSTFHFKSHYKSLKQIAKNTLRADLSECF